MVLRRFFSSPCPISTERALPFQLYKSPARREALLMGPSQHDHTGILVILGLLGLIFYRFVVLRKGEQRAPDPWDEEIEKEINQDDAVPLCHHCLTPQTHDGWFCPECGATVGPYSNFMPFVYIFSQGEALRTGVTERVRPKPIIVIGYVLFPLCMYQIFAPIYWYFLFKNLLRSDATPPEAQPDDAPHD